LGGYLNMCHLNDAVHWKDTLPKDTFPSLILHWNVSRFNQSLSLTQRKS